MNDKKLPSFSARVGILSDSGPHASQQIETMNRGVSNSTRNPFLK